MARGPWWLALVTACGPSNGPEVPVPCFCETDLGSVATDVQRDTFVQVLPAQVDVLWAVSDAPTMGPLRDELVDALPAFFDGLLGSGVDYHLGVIHTDLQAGGGALVDAGFGKFVDADTPSPVDALAAAMSVGTGGGDVDQEGLAAVHAAWFDLAVTANAGFYRPSAEVHTVVFTDSDDASTTITPAAFVQDYATLGVARTFTVLGDPAHSAVYGSVADDLGGSVLDATSGDLAATLGALGVQGLGYRQEFFLSRIPDPATLDVSVEEVSGALFDHFVEATPDAVSGELVGDWTYDAARNSVTFLDYLPPPLSTVRVEYLPAGT